MTQETWSLIQSHLEDIATEVSNLDDVCDECKVSDLGRELECISANIKTSSDSIYSICEEDYANTPDESEVVDEDVAAVIPNTMTLGDKLSLIDTIKAWRESHGFGLND